MKLAFVKERLYSFQLSTNWLLDHQTAPEIPPAIPWRLSLIADFCLSKTNNPTSTPTSCSICPGTKVRKMTGLAFLCRALFFPHVLATLAASVSVGHTDCDEIWYGYPHCFGDLLTFSLLLSSHTLRNTFASTT